MPYVVWQLDTELRVIHQCGQLQELVGTHVGRTLYEIQDVDPEFSGAIAASLLALTGVVVPYERHYHGYDWRVWLAPLIEDGETIGVIGTAVLPDRERQRVEQEERAYRCVRAVGQWIAPGDGVLYRPHAPRPRLLLRDLPPAVVAQAVADGSLVALTPSDRDHLQTDAPSPPLAASRPPRRPPPAYLRLVRSS